MFCRYCGKEVPDDSIFCSYCQKQLNDAKKDETTASVPNEETHEKLTVKPFVRAQHIRKDREVVPKSESTNMGVISWVLSSYSILTIFMLIIGVLGYVTSPVVEGASFSFKQSAERMLISITFLVGKLPAPVGAPLWITAVIPFTFVAMALTFAIIQFVRSKKLFSKITLIAISSLTFVMLILNIFLYEVIMRGLGI